MTINELTSYYASLLAYEYRGLPNASQQIQLWTKQAVADFFAAQLLSCFDINSAVGKQLDVLGKYVGAPRNVGVVLSRPFFSLWSSSSVRDPALYKGTWVPASNSPAIPTAGGGNNGWWYVAYADGVSTAPIAGTWNAGDIIFSNGSAWAKETDDCGNGLTTSTDLSVNLNGVFYSTAFYSGQNADLTDEEYRTVIKLKAILNSNDGTLASIMGYLNRFFPGLVSLLDNQDMTMNYVVVSTIALSKELLQIYLPRPMGVGITITIVSPSPVGGGHLTTEEGSILTTEDGSPITTETT